VTQYQLSPQEQGDRTSNIILAIYNGIHISDNAFVIVILLELEVFRPACPEDILVAVLLI
jgi:hypothetical protein